MSPPSPGLRRVVAVVGVVLGLFCDANNGSGGEWLQLFEGLFAVRHAQMVSKPVCVLLLVVHTTVGSTYIRSNESSHVLSLSRQAIKAWKEASEISAKGGGQDKLVQILNACAVDFQIAW